MGTGSVVIIVGGVALFFIILAIQRRQLVGDAETSSQHARIMIFAIMGALVFFAIGDPFVRDVLRSAKDRRIQAHGGRTEASVSNIYTYTCPRHGPCHLGVTYQYIAPSAATGMPAQYTGDDILGRREGDDPRTAYAYDKRHVPIAYDLQDPNASAVNFGDSIFNTDPYERLRRKWDGTGKILLSWLGLLALGALTFPIIRRWRVVRGG